MSARVARIEAGDEMTVVGLQLDVDYHSVEAVEIALDGALSLGRPVVVDLSDCTFLELCSLRALAEAYGRARQEGIPFVVVFPFDGTPVVRRLLLELVSELAPFPLVPSRDSARRRVAAVQRPVATDLQALRLRFWDQAATANQLVARRDELLFEQRRALANLGPRTHPR